MREEEEKEEEREVEEMNGGQESRETALVDSAPWLQRWFKVVQMLWI